MSYLSPMDKMQAVLLRDFGGPEQFYIGQAEIPSCSNHEVLVKIHSTALNRADTLQREGKYAPPKGASTILGLEVSGEIVSTSEHASKYKNGDRVCGLLAGGGYAEYINIHEDLLLKIPDHMDMVDAAAIPEVFLTAYQSLIYLLQLQRDETILIHAGASGVGTAAIQMARRIGAKVFTTASAGKHDICKSLGADVVIDYKSESFKSAVIKASDQKGVHAILDFIAGPYYADNLEVLGIDGRMVMLAALGGMTTADVNVAQIVWKRLKIMGSTLRSRSLDYKAQLVEDFRAQFWGQFADGAMKPIIDSVVSWHDVDKAHARMDQNLNQGKIVMTIGD